jgi:hypothetical protein
MVELWNPHQPKENKGTSPEEFRVFCSQGRVRLYTGSLEDPTKAPKVYGYGIYQPPGTPENARNTDPSITAPITRPNGMKSSSWLSIAGNSLTFSVASNKFDELFTWPTLLTQRVSGASVGSPSSNNRVVDGPVQFVGFYVGQVACSSDTYGNYMGSIWNPCYGGFMDNNPIAPVTFYLQYKDGTSWVSYSDWQNVTISGMWDGGGNRGPGDPTSPILYLQAADPRSSRFGLFLNYTHERTADPRWSDPSWTGGPDYQDSIGMTMRPDSTQTMDTVFAGLPYGVGLQAQLPLGPGWGPSSLANNPDGTPSYRFGYLAENKDTLPTWYKDNDGILRNGDAAYASGVWGQPLEQVSPAAGQVSRPLILDRPFRSVAEMGYAFRDLPFKSLDFFTANSADAALLDVFCLNETPASGVVAGVINPNTPHQPVLKAVLANALKNELDASSTIAVSEAEKVATKIKTATATTPLINRSDLATKIIPALVSGDFANNPADAAIKARRESVVRALADVSNTRTWNLLIDVVAQTGSYPASSTESSQFSVTGESHYWLHVAIDSFTAQIVDQYLEQVPTGPAAIGFNTTSTSSIEVAEKQPVGTILGTINATNSTPGSTASYGLVSGAGDNDNSSFTIIGNTVQAAAVLNYLTQSTYTIRVRATDQLGLSFDQSLTINLLPNPYTQWKITNFSTSAGDPKVAGDTASPSGDNIPNLIKYALGLNPMLPTGNGITVMAKNNNVIMQYNRAGAATDTTVHALWSNDLKTWSNTGVSQTKISDNNTSQLWQATLPINNQSPGIFMRLKVTSP